MTAKFESAEGLVTLRFAECDEGAHTIPLACARRLHAALGQILGMYPFPHGSAPHLSETIPLTSPGGWRITCE